MKNKFDFHTVDFMKKRQTEMIKNSIDIMLN